MDPHFALQVSSWIRTLFTKGQVNIKLLKEQENKINRSTKKIKILEDSKENTLEFFGAHKNSLLFLDASWF